MIDEAAIERNCRILERVKKETDCKILLAQKAFSAFDCYPLIAKYLDGTTSSGLFEARLAAEKFIFGNNKKESHVFAPAFTDEDMREIVKIADHIVFNSAEQLFKHYDICKKHGLEIGLRVNPEYSTQSGSSPVIYDPCAPFSRFGVTADEFAKNADQILSKTDGLHFHTLCEQGFEPLAQTVAVFERKFGKYIKALGNKNTKETWVNFGGGHHITKPDYDVVGLVKLINDFKARYAVQVYLEPGEAVVLESGFLTASVLDIVHNAKSIAIMDTSAACHNPDILETQHHYTPSVIDAVNLNEDTEKTNSHAGGFKHVYQLAGNTCLTGDIIGDYAFKKPLRVGDNLTFTNMALYTMVKTNMFNGINLPAIYVRRLSGKIELLCEFGYDDYKMRLGRGTSLQILGVKTF